MPEATTHIVDNTGALRFIHPPTQSQVQAVIPLQIENGFNVSLIPEQKEILESIRSQVRELDGIASTVNSLNGDVRRLSEIQTYIQSVASKAEQTFREVRDKTNPRLSDLYSARNYYESILQQVKQLLIELRDENKSISARQQQTINRLSSYLAPQSVRGKTLELFSVGDNTLLSPPSQDLYLALYGVEIMPEEPVSISLKEEGEDAFWQMPSWVSGREFNHDFATCYRLQKGKNLVANLSKSVNTVFNIRFSWELEQ